MQETIIQDTVMTFYSPVQDISRIDMSDGDNISSIIIIQRMIRRTLLKIMTRKYIQSSIIHKVIEIQRIVRGFLIRNIFIVCGRYQTPDWRKKQDWYSTGKKNECEIYQRDLVERITHNKCTKTNYRISIITNDMCINPYPMKETDGFEWTEDFDGYMTCGNNRLFINLKFVCGNGGAQIRTLREVYHFILHQLNYIVNHSDTDIQMINILDGDIVYKHIDKFKYLLNKECYSSACKKIFIGDMHAFRIFWNNNYK